MKITKIVVMTHTSATDHVYVHTELPSPFPAVVSTQPLAMGFEFEAGKGIEYVRAHFPGVYIEELNYKTGIWSTCV